jgi:ATP phosphoribosyltransferase
MKPLKIAVSKGRVKDQLIALLKEAGFEFEDLKSRKLEHVDTTGRISLISVKADDVTTYVERAAADLGVLGSDILYERSFDGYELRYLPIGKCRMCVAGFRGFNLSERSFVRIATKYPKRAKDLLEEKGINGEILFLSGSVELAPIVNLADCILDIVETGKTLEENDLVVLETIGQISSVLIANRISFKLMNDRMMALLNDLDAAEKRSAAK